MKKTILTMVLATIFVASVVAAQQGMFIPTVCCEETTSDLFCQNVPDEECKEGMKQAPTACESTSFCRGGYCYSSFEGTCLPNTPKKVCDENGGTWSEEFPPQCNLGCCVLGDQAAFVTLPRCKRLSSVLGLQTIFKGEITDEVGCILSVQSEEKGACVYEFEFERLCKMTVKAECDAGVGETGATGEFHPGLLCTAEELGTACAPTSQKRCLDGRDDVYFVDSCGNIANIFDSDKVNDREYWRLIRGEEESCNPDSSNANSDDCGNCNYLLGSICRESGGDSICVDLNCRGNEEILGGEKNRLHGESWCINKDTEDSGIANSVGSRQYRYLCVNGEVVQEQCADFRQEACFEDFLELANGGRFTQAACRVNRWQDCAAQTDANDCGNTDQRDCVWMAQVNKIGTTGTGSASGICVPITPPGLAFWQGEDATTHCSLGHATCIVKQEGKLEGIGDVFKEVFGSADEEDFEWEYVENEHCIQPGWLNERVAACQALGDCGGKRNWVGESGRKSYEYSAAVVPQ